MIKITSVLHPSRRRLHRSEDTESAFAAFHALAAAFCYSPPIQSIPLTYSPVCPPPSLKDGSCQASDSLMRLGLEIQRSLGSALPSALSSLLPILHTRAHKSYTYLRLCYMKKRNEKVWGKLAGWLLQVFRLFPTERISWRRGDQRLGPGEPVAPS